MVPSISKNSQNRIQDLPLSFADAIVQCTLFSRILPDKALLKISGKSVLSHIVGRLKRVAGIGKIFLATTDEALDDPLVEHGRLLGMEIVRGSPNDLVNRLAAAARQSDEKTLLKVNGNYPLLDPEAAFRLLWIHIAHEYQYSFNEHPSGMPIGMGCEVIQKKMLLELDEDQNLTASQRESGTLYFQQNQDGYRVLRQDCERPRPNYKLSLETESDLQMLAKIMGAIRIPRMESVIEYLDNHPSVAKSNLSLQGVKEIGLEKLWLFPDKVKSILNLNGNGPDHSFPISVELSLTNRCNLECEWCSDMDLRGRLGDDLSLEIISRLIKELAAGGTRGVVIEGGGEPAISKNLEEAVRLSTDNSMSCGLITNGTRKLKPDILQRLNWIRVSLDASNPKEFEQAKKRDLFERVMQNIDYYAKNCPVVGIGYVVTKNNCHSLEPLVQRLRGMGVRYIQFRPVIDHPELEPEFSLDYLMRYNHPGSLQVIVDGMEENRIKGNQHLPCKAHSLTTVITADGGVYLCGRLNVYPWFKAMGNLNELSFTEIWNGAARAEQSTRVQSAEFCATYCPECRITKFNSLFSRLDNIASRDFI